MCGADRTSWSTIDRAAEPSPRVRGRRPWQAAELAADVNHPRVCGADYMNTELNEAFIADPDRSEQLSVIPAGRVSKRSEVGGAAVFLTSSAAGYVRGQCWYRRRLRCRSMWSTTVAGLNFQHGHRSLAHRIVFDGEHVHRRPAEQALGGQQGLLPGHDQSWRSPSRTSASIRVVVSTRPAIQRNP